MVTLAYTAYSSVHKLMLFRMELMKYEMKFMILPQTDTKHPLR